MRLSGEQMCLNQQTWLWIVHSKLFLPSSVDNQTGKEDDEEVMCVPEDLKVASSDDFHGGGDDQDERQSDDDPCEASDGGEHNVDWNLLRILEHKVKQGNCVSY